MHCAEAETGPEAGPEAGQETGGASKLVAFGREDLTDLLGDHALMRAILVHCVDNAWYGGAVFASRAHFDTAERPERRNVALVRGDPRGELVRRLLDAEGGGPDAEERAADAGERAADAGERIPEARAPRPRRGPERTPAFMRGSSGLLGELCRRDVAAVFDGVHWVPTRVEDCVHAVNKRFVEAVAGYLREFRETVHDIAPAVEEMLDDYRMGAYRHHCALSEAVAEVLDRHAVGPAEFLEMSGLGGPTTLDL